MKNILIIGMVLLNYCLQAQDSLLYAGKSFFAISVPDAMTASNWYEDIFQLKLLKEIKQPENGVHVRIVGNDFLLVEILEHKASVGFKDARVPNNQQPMLQHIFKAGIYVRNVYTAIAWLQLKQVSIKNGPFDDKTTGIRSVIIEDPNGLLIQLMEEIK